MKTETQITQYNIKVWRREVMDIFIRVYYYACEQHKSTCQRFLEFFELFREDMQMFDLMDNQCDRDLQRQLDQSLTEKITDLKQAIKLYNEAGI